MSEFKVGDTVRRVTDVERFTKYYRPVVDITSIDSAGNLEFQNDRHYWNSEYFELYEPKSQPMKPLVSIYDKALDLRFEHEILGDVSLREFFCTLLVKLWDDPCGFSGKRPWGNSDWDAPVYAVLIKAGIITGELDSDGYIKDCDYCTGSEFISKMITHTFDCSFNKD